MTRSPGFAEVALEICAKPSPRLIETLPVTAVTVAAETAEVRTKQKATATKAHRRTRAIGILSPQERNNQP
jgi:hypothetical protein